ncbi:MAG: TRAP transporter large permease subunit, partial [Alphaproteobacteria bacterium]
MPIRQADTLAESAATDPEAHAALGVEPRGGRFPQLERALAWITELPAAVLVVVETIVLFAGVVSRYVFDRPLTWSDELASVLFLWLAMLGAVIALRRGEHMRLTAIVAYASPARRRWLDTLAAMISALFVIEIIPSAAAYVESEWAIITPALEMHDGLRVLAIGTGAVLMMAIALFRLVERSTLRHALTTLAAMALAAAALWLARPALLSLGNFNLVIFFVLIVGVCVAIGVPIAFSFGVATLSYLALLTHVPLTVVINRMDQGMSTLVLLSVPLFVFLGLLIEMAGLARVLVDFLAALIGHLRGGLAYVLLGAIYLVSGISGSKAADMAAVAPVLFPEMKRRGARPGELVALLSSSGAMAETIPPSLVLITIGSVTGVSISALFTGGLLPALVAAFALVVVCFFRTRGEDLSHVRRASARDVLRAFVVSLPALVLPFLIRAAVIEGVATATE